MSGEQIKNSVSTILTWLAKGSVAITTILVAYYVQEIRNEQRIIRKEFTQFTVSQALKESDTKIRDYRIKAMNAKLELLEEKVFNLENK